ncbi:hypothetical protein AUC43_13665 [Hymenobacter sedentarius]|uniref:Glycosyltransferase RgtA/B/C/D-like domain-containing protein n=1 Tax=Hymenobacter sedentarius TaxID=1411621 RepID=A0A0U4ACY4_9BACT|nr:hypothetical protein [Hymenobacter sedentarius]ALW86044.1 hypothetical protein AUC43_13665 [Hymenobacter sedentarius]
MLLPLALTLGTVAGLGSYYETSDDASLAWLFSGVMALKPVASLPLYFHGYGHVLAAAYTALPNWPWFGLLNAGLLGLATVLVFAVLDRLLRSHLRPAALVLVLVVFFGVAWLEHWLWFSHVRVGVLLSGASVLFAAQRPGRGAPLIIGLAGLGAAWLMRPSLALMGFVAVLPAAVLLAGGIRRAAPVILSAVLGLALAAGTAALLQTPTEARAQARDRYFARVLDFDQLRPQPRTPADSLGTAALSLWLMGDSTVVNEALCQRAYVFNAREFFAQQVPAKIMMRAGQLARDYFPLLLALAATALGKARKRRQRPLFWLVQLSFAAALVLCAGFLKLPPRLALPLLDFWLITNLAFVFSAQERSAGLSSTASVALPRGLRLLGLVAVQVVVLLYGAKTLHRRQVLGQEERRHRLALQSIAQARAGRILILAGSNDLLKSLSPFRTYSLGPGPVLVLTGWQSHDASQSQLRRALSGTADQTECLRRLAAPAQPGPAPVWVLTPETAAWLSRRFRFDGPRMQLSPTFGEALPTDSTLRFYRVQPWPAR